MTATKVRCWKIHVPGTKHDDDLLITYPEGHYGHVLWSCLGCGQIYAASVEDEMYLGPPAQEKINSLTCIQCGTSLANSAAPYPEKYRNHEGEICSYERSQTMPNDEDSMVVELPDIYS